MKQKITAGTITRTVLLAVALANSIATSLGHAPLPIDNELVTQVISVGFMAVTSVLAWWKNNSFTEKAIEADKLLKKEV